MYNDSSTVAGLAEHLKTSIPANYSLSLRFGEDSLFVRSNSRNLIEELRKYYREFTAPAATASPVIYAFEAEPPEFDFEFKINPPDPGKQKIKEEYFDLADGRIVRKRLTGMLFIFGGSHHIAIGPTLKNSNQVVNFINNRLIQWSLDRGAMLFHAAGIELEGRGMALAGFSGAGKSSLALHLMAHGVNFVSNDRLMVRGEGENIQMSGVPKLPRINPGTILSIPELAVHFVNDTINRYKDLTPEQLWHLEEKYDAFIDDIYGSNRFIIKTDLHALVLLTWKREPGETAMKQVDLNERPDLMPAFMKSPGLFYLTDAEGALRARDRRNYLDLLNKVPVYEISGGVNFDLATQFCLDIVGNVSESAIK